MSQRRRLTSLDELGRLYPFRTKDLRERFGRELMLPALFEYARSCQPHYLRADNEAHVMREADDGARDRLNYAWQALDQRLVRLEAQLPDSRNRNVFELRVRGMELFGPGRVHHERAFDFLLRKAMEEAEVDEEKLVLDAVRQFYDTEFPHQDVDRASMKTMLYSAVDTRSGHRPGLKPAAGWYLVDFLLKKAPQVAAAIGCRPRAKRPSRSGSLEAFLDERKGPNLGRLGARLLDRDAFAKFTFVQRAPPIGRLAAS